MRATVTSPGAHSPRPTFGSSSDAYRIVLSPAWTGRTPRSPNAGVGQEINYLPEPSWKITATASDQV
jgi:hypothetical protein